MLAPATAQLSEFGGDGPRLLLGGNACHADIGLDSPGSGFIGMLLTMLGQTVGFPVPEGGAGQLTAALHRRLTERGGQVSVNAPVHTIMVRGGRAVGVQCLDQTVRVRRAVLADVGAEQLYGGLVGTDELPARLVAKDEWLPSRPGDLQGRLRAVRAGAVGLAPGVRPGHGAHRRLLRRPASLRRPARRRRHPRPAVPADGADDHHRPDPLTGRDGVTLGLHPPASAGPRRRRREI